MTSETIKFHTNFSPLAWADWESWSLVECSDVNSQGSGSQINNRHCVDTQDSNAVIDVKYCQEMFPNDQDHQKVSVCSMGKLIRLIATLLTPTSKKPIVLLP